MHPSISQSVIAILLVVARRVHIFTVVARKLHMRKMYVEMITSGPRFVSESCWNAGDDVDSSAMVARSGTTVICWPRKEVGQTRGDET